MRHCEPPQSIAIFGISANLRLTSPAACARSRSPQRSHGLDEGEEAGEDRKWRSSRQDSEKRSRSLRWLSGSGVVIFAQSHPKEPAAPENGDIDRRSKVIAAASEGLGQSSPTLPAMPAEQLACRERIG
jgi:hypothetical protein